MHINFCTKMKVKITVAENGRPPPPTATMNRARGVSVDRALKYKRKGTQSACGRRHTAHAVKQRAATKL